MNISVVWFRRDLRLLDNEIIDAAANTGAPCLFVFVIDPWFFKQPEIGWLRVKFLFESLAALDDQLQKHGNKLHILRGASAPTIQHLLQALRQKNYNPTLFFSYDIQVTYGKERDDAVTRFCAQHAIAVQKVHNYFLLHTESKMDDWWKQYYEYQNAPQLKISELPKPTNNALKIIEALLQFSPQTIAKEMGLKLPDSQQRLFTGGEVAAHQAAYSFLKDRVNSYHWKISRPFLVQKGATSLLSPHLAFGTISSRTVFQAANNYLHKVEKVDAKKGFSIATYLDRLRWRDSFTQRLFFHPELMWQNRFAEFDGIYNQTPLSSQQQEYFDRWKEGTTGFPLLDAAMRQLKADGFINFRMRAMAATFLTINCGVSWHYGAQHFMNYLVDGDIAINHWQWQMQAGITNPLSPVFRMYSPTKNLRERDGNADYVHYWLPDTKGMSIDNILTTAKPMLDFNETRKVKGKVIADLRKQVRERIITEKGLEYEQATAASRVTRNYSKYSRERYKRYSKSGASK